jgi:hypothetical protein
MRVGISIGVVLVMTGALGCSVAEDDELQIEARISQTLGQPFAQTSYVCQSYRGFSHAGNYPLDIGLTSSSCNAGNNDTGGATVVAPASGTVTKLPTGGLGDYMCIAFTGGGAAAFGHVKPISGISTNTSVTKGQAFATVAHSNDGTSSNNGIAHLHFEVFDGSGCYGGNAPKAFSGAFRMDCAPDLPFNATPNHYNGTQLTPCDGPGGSGGTCIPTPIAGAENEVFHDMPAGTFGKAEAIAIYDANITAGCSANPPLFCPTCELPRDQAVTMLVRAEKISIANPPATPSFSDVPTDHPFYAYIEAAVKAGITAGCGGGNFCPDAIVTRAQLATFVVRTRGWPVVSPATPTFPTDVPTNHAFYNEIETAYEYCVTAGCGVDMFCPEQNATRAHAAIFIARAYDLDGLNPCRTPPGSGDSGETGGADGTSVGDDDDGAGVTGSPQTGGVDGESGGGGASSTAASTGASTDDSDATATATGDESGCGCRLDARHDRSLSLGALLLALGLRRRKRPLGRGRAKSTATLRGAG